MDNTIILAYHSANRETANIIDQQLSRANYHFEHLICDEGESRLHERLAQTNKQIVMLISDNFLCCEDCMYELLPVYQELVRAKRVQPVVTEGVYFDEETGITTRRPTSFDRMSNVIHYMNYWQDQYLEVRRQKRQVSSEEELALNEELRVIRSISSEIGEFMRFFRNGDYVHWETFKGNRYYAFFEFTNSLDKHQDFQPIEIQESLETTYPEENAHDELEDQVEADQISDLDGEESELGTFLEDEVDVSQIPGMNLLNTTNEEDDLLSSTIDTSEYFEATPETENLTEEEQKQEEHTVSAVEEEDYLSIDLSDSTFSDEEHTSAEAEAAQASIFSNVTDDSQENYDEQEENEEEAAVNFSSVEEVIVTGNAMIAEGQVYTALRRFEEGIAHFPSDVGLRYTFAQAILKYREDYSSAKRQLEKMLEYDPRNTDAYFLIGELDEIQGNYESAKLNFERVINIDSSYPNVHYRLANLLANKFEAQEATALYHFSLSLSQDAKNADAHYQYAILQEQYVQDQEKAIEHYQQAIALRPDHPYAHYDLAVLYHQLGQHKAAATAYQQAAEINPEVDTAQNNRIFLGKESLVTNGYDHSEVEASKALIGQLQDDIKRLEDLVAKNQNLLEDAHQGIADLPVMQEATATDEVIAEVDDFIEEKQEKVEAAPLGTVLITGATSGIGKATADLFAAKGYRLILTGRRDKRLEELKQHYQDTYQSEVQTLNFDVRDPMAVESYTEQLAEEWRSVDILINNAGLAKGFEPIHEGKLSDWETMIDTNIKGLLYMTRAVSPWMVKAGQGHIINVCSIAGKEVYPNGSVYCATKHAVDALTKGMRLDLHKHGIRVSQVSPAHVEETEFALVRYEGDSERAKIYEDFQPLRASDVADTIFYLATRPPHVNIQDVVMLGTQQASATTIDRSGRGQMKADEIERETGEMEAIKEWR